VVFSIPFAAAQQIEQPPEIAQFQKVEDQWSDSLMKRDQYALELLMAPTYIDISSTGEVTTRNQQIAALYERSTADPVSMEQRVVNVRTIEDVAVVDGTYVLKTKTNGVVHDERGIFTQVYQHTHGNWVCVHSQRTAIVDKTDTRTKTAKKSNAELPFHVPFFHKGAESTQSTSQSTSQTPAQNQSQPAQAPQ
jgi:hypothetical protein